MAGHLIELREEILRDRVEAADQTFLSSELVEVLRERWRIWSIDGKRNRIGKLVV
jgi:hypothetical protein